MTRDIRYVFEDDSIQDAADSMAEQQVRRLPVADGNKRLVGIISLGDLAEDGDHPCRASSVLAEVSRPGGAHSQTGGARR